MPDKKEGEVYSDSNHYRAHPRVNPSDLIRRSAEIYLDWRGASKNYTIKQIEENPELRRKFQTFKTACENLEGLSATDCLDALSGVKKSNGGKKGYT
ncbi:hypothetical protein HY448_01500 [Candidatus Pacearchaeota archaeon]|nr:hypothetical protein [Candidatus Pacearchaeota archaeon]